jgi:hypothetical protein
VPFRASFCAGAGRESGGLEAFGSAAAASRAQLSSNEPLLEPSMCVRDLLRRHPVRHPVRPVSIRAGLPARQQRTKHLHIGRFTGACARARGRLRHPGRHPEPQACLHAAAHLASWALTSPPDQLAKRVRRVCPRSNEGGAMVHGEPPAVIPFRGRLNKRLCGASAQGLRPSMGQRARRRASMPESDPATSTTRRRPRPHVGVSAGRRGS